MAARRKTGKAGGGPRKGTPRTAPARGKMLENVQVSDTQRLTKQPPIVNRRSMMPPCVPILKTASMPASSSADSMPRLCVMPCSAARVRMVLRVMPFKPPADMSKFLLSPMPGLLSDIVVKSGQAVQAGERLAVIEAMKMENILVAQQDGVVAKVSASRGESLAVDQVIMEFQ